MKLNINFDPKLEAVINLCPTLADWFERNQETLVYYELTHGGCNYIDTHPYATVDLKVLGRMANAGLICLEESGYMIEPEVRAFQAALAIAKIYEEEKEWLSEESKIQYFIDAQELLKHDTQEKGRII